MRLLITADLHLSAKHPERQAALAEVLRIGEDAAVDAVLIAGDLFDAGTDVDQLKTDIRDLFTGNSFRTYAIPGNHDQEAFRAEDYFGADIEVVSTRPFEQIDLGPVHVLAMPFIEGHFSDYVDDLHAAREDDSVNVLMLHGTLSTTTGRVFGEESRYLPFTPEQLLETGADYVFAGHIHSAPTKRSYGDDECVFAYPGSPISVTTKETGRRGVWLFDTDEKTLREVVVESAYYVREPLELSPGEADAELADLASRLTDRDLDHATILVEPSGFIEMDVGQFFEQLEAILEEASPAGYRIKRDELESAKTIIRSELYREFERKLAEVDSGVDEQAVRRIALQALSAEERG